MHGEEMEEIIAEIQERSNNPSNGDRSAMANAAEQQAVSEAVTEGLFKPHGTPPNSKQDGIFPISCENPNGLNNAITRSHKLDKAIDIKDELEADGLLYCKHRLILHNKDNRNGFKQMFQCTVEYQVVAGNNVHQNIGQVQEGGTGTAVFGGTVGYIVKTGKGPFGLEQWCWTLYGGNHGHNTQVIVAYNACKNNKKDSRTTYQQQHQYFITAKKDLTCPSKHFCQHLIHQLKQWWLRMDRLILFMDHNEHTYGGQLGKALADSNGLGLQEAILQHTGTRMGPTFFWGSKPINGLCVSSKIEFANACVMHLGMRSTTTECLSWTSSSNLSLGGCQQRSFNQHPGG
jgi:hypothetical protein